MDEAGSFIGYVDELRLCVHCSRDGDRGVTRVFDADLDRWHRYGDDSSLLFHKANRHPQEKRQESEERDAGVE